MLPLREISKEDSNKSCEVVNPSVFIRNAIGYVILDNTHNEIHMHHLHVALVESNCAYRT